MIPETFIFIGRSGCGKGTQAELLIKDLRDRSKRPVFHLESGALFRDFVEGDSFSSRLAKEIMERGERQPDFLAVWMWSHLLVKNLVEEEHLVLDGTPRSLVEAKSLDTAMDFYQREKPKVIYLNISPETSVERLTSRDRSDDRSVANIAKKLAWFETSVVPAIEYYKANADYDFFEINGEQSIEDIHTEIKSKLNWNND